MRRASVLILLTAIAPFLAGRCCLAVTSFAAGVQTGTIQNSSITEASGIAASRKNANVLWTHNDSGNPAQVFAMTPAGTNLAAYTLTGTTNRDWEDISVGPGPTVGAQYLYVGEIGDNNAVYPSVAIYRVPEPVASATQSPVTANLSGSVKFTFTYPDGPRDADSMFVDPQTKDIYIISKRESPHHVYRAAYSQATDSYAGLVLATTFVDADWLTAGDISPDGSEIIVRGYPTTSGRMFVRSDGGTITDAFNTTPITIPVHSENQGEAIGFDPNGWGYYTTSEGSNQPIYYFNRQPHGDFNHNGMVEAADYAVWRKGLGSVYQASNYTTWRANYGKSAPGDGAGSLVVAIPEPGAWALAMMGVAAIFLRMPRSCRRPVVSVLLSPR